MGFQVEQRENDIAMITVAVPQTESQKVVTVTYNHEKGKYQVQGFRKGCMSQAAIKKFCGQGVFFESAVNSYINDTYPEAVKENGLTIVSHPEINMAEVDMDKDLVYVATVATKPEVKLGQYKGVEVQKTDTMVTDEGLDEALQKELEKNAHLVTVDDRATETDDNAKIDFGGGIDGVYSDGGKGENYPPVLGGGGFIDGFEERIVGHKTGGSFDINVTFPTEYHTRELAGEEVAFACKLLETQKKDLPELNDGFASEASRLETFDEYKAGLKKQLEEARAKSAAAQNENNVVEKVVENAELALPVSMVEMQCEQMLDDYARRMQPQGLPLEQYLRYTGMTVERLRGQLRPQAERDLKIRLVLEEVVEAENIMVSEETINAKITKIAEVYKVVPERMKGYVSIGWREKLAVNLKVQEAVDFFVAEARLR